VLVCHGLEGSSRAPYVRGLVAGSLRRGLSAAALNFRGCSGEMNRLPRFYHSGETEDLAYAVGRLAGERPGRPLCLAGFSLGGNVVTKYLAERGQAAPSQLVAAAVISVPFDLAACARPSTAPVWCGYRRGSCAPCGVPARRGPSPGRLTWTGARAIRTRRVRRASPRRCTASPRRRLLVLIQPGRISTAPAVAGPGCGRRSHRAGGVVRLEASRPTRW
jgi:hypothetical protein